MDQYFGNAENSTGLSQDARRETTNIRLNVTPEHEARIVSNLQEGPGETGKVVNNCAQRSSAALNAGGAIPLKPVPMAGGVGYARQSAVTPEVLQGLVEDAAFAGSSQTRGTEAGDPATKTKTIMDNAGKPSES